MTVATLTLSDRRNLLVRWMGATFIGAIVCLIFVAVAGFLFVLGIVYLAGHCSADCAGTERNALICWVAALGLAALGSMAPGVAQAWALNIRRVVGGLVTLLGVIIALVLFRLATTGLDATFLTNSDVVGALMIAVAANGLFVGFGQALLMRWPRRWAMAWTMATALGWVLGIAAVVWSLGLFDDGVYRAPSLSAVAGPALAGVSILAIVTGLARAGLAQVSLTRS